MSLKSVEMQIAIPRTNDAGVAQNQLSHKPMHDQAALAAGAMLQAEQLRKKTGQVEGAVHKRIKDGSGKHREDAPKSGSQGSKPSKKQADETTGHPYKGRHIDLSL